MRLCWPTNEFSSKPKALEIKIQTLKKNDRHLKCRVETFNLKIVGSISVIRILLYIFLYTQNIRIYQESYKCVLGFVIFTTFYGKFINNSCLAHKNTSVIKNLSCVISKVYKKNLCIILLPSSDCTY